MKYVHRYPDGPNEFYDLEADPDETSNQIDNPAFLQSIEGMRVALQEWFERYTEPERDGSNQAVMGRGQLDVVGGESEVEYGSCVEIVDMRDPVVGINISV